MEKTDNEIIAEFMGYETSTHESLGLLYSLPKYLVRHKRPSWVTPSNLKFSPSWDWLMPVVAKITPIAKDIGQLAWFDVGSFLLSGDIEVVLKRVVEFIKWYNSLNHQTNS